MASFNIKKIKKRFKNFSLEKKKRESIAPYRHWGILFIIFTILLVATIGIHAQIFLQTNSNEIFKIDNQGSEKKKTLDPERLKRNIELYENRKNTFDALKQSPPEIVDPGL